VYARISTENCGLLESSNDGRKFSTTGAQYDPRVVSLPTRSGRACEDLEARLALAADFGCMTLGRADRKIRSASLLKGYSPSQNHRTTQVHPKSHVRSRE
jgi:hypothetical protein